MMARFEIKMPEPQGEPYRPLPTGAVVNAALDKVIGSVECPRCHATTIVEKLADVPTSCPVCGHGATR